jgi:Predicted Rossmann fold nucleotide-binding protein involved in DNA uptake
VIVVEAKERSGALITADMALEDNRDVYAIPGRIDSSLSKGCNKLIQEGAIPLINFNEL